jgi:Peptide N-acetyl-beta-D-glucosaminyl asparaginase amidase A
MQSARYPRPRFRGPLFAVLSVAIAIPLAAQSPSSHSESSLYPPLSTGTSLEATADPTIPRPNTKNCEVTLLSNQAFADFNNKDFTFTPPADCPGPWARVILTADFSIQAGVQFDRTAQLFFGNVNIFFGTTAEPLQSVADTWHVERDLTDYTSLFKTAQTGYASLGNIVGADGLTSTIFGTFKLEFYQANFANPSPKTADLVVPIQNGGNSSFTINSGTPEVTQSVTFPKNTERIYLDVLSQSQNAEEQWFLCVPESIAGPLNDCQNTAFRETEISIDGKPAGVAPVYPWIYTGGVDPGLWVPIPGVQTLNFIPYRVDLTPFAGVLDDGQAHTVGVSVYNAYSYFTVTAQLLVFEDHGKSQLSGGLTTDTLTAPNPAVTDTVNLNSSGVGSGQTTVSNAHNFVIAGYVNTSHGRVDTKVEQQVNFDSVANITSTANTYAQNNVQTSTVNAVTTTQEGPIFTTNETSFSYPISISFLETVESNGNITQATTLDQKYLKEETQTLEGFPIFHSSVSNEVKPTDNAVFVLTPNGYALGPNSGQSSSQNYVYQDSLGHCYSRKLTVSNNVLNTVTDGAACQEHHIF